ncbi:helix-turn-helix domain-containing protein [Variovorax sp. LARHSF232]
MRQRQVASPLPTPRPLKLPASLALAVARRRQLPLSEPRSASAELVGQQVRALRLCSGASAGKLAANAGISRSMLSRIERGLVCASVETLERIAVGLGVGLARLFVQPSGRSTFCHVPAGMGTHVQHTGEVAEHCRQMLGQLRSGNLCIEPWLVRLGPEAETFGASSQQAKVQFVYTLAGRLACRIGDQVVELSAGDSLLLGASIEFGVEAIGAQAATYLFVTFTLRT